MKLELMRELEDLKKLESELVSSLNTKIQNTVKRIVGLCLDDFESFFTSKKFKVEKDARNAIASYGNLKASLSSQPDEGYIGYTFVFDLTIAQENYDVSIASSQRGMVSTSYSDTKDPIGKLKVEIERKRNDIEQTKERINNFAQESWYLELRPKVSTKNNHAHSQSRQSVKRFSTMHELLTHLNTGQE